MTIRIDSRFLTSEHCFSCRKCCKFEPDEFVDAPLFTPDQVRMVETTFGAGTFRFEAVGKLFRIVLLDIRGSEKKICPFYEERSGACRVFSFEVFDCHTWPFYLMRTENGVLVTVSQDCPIVSKASIDQLVEYARTRIGPAMLEVANAYPDLVTPIHGNVTPLCSINELRGPLSLESHIPVAP